MNGPLWQGALKILCGQGLGSRGGDHLGARRLGLGEVRLEPVPARRGQDKSLNFPVFIADGGENGVPAVKPDGAVRVPAATPRRLLAPAACGARRPAGSLAFAHARHYISHTDSENVNFAVQRLPEPLWCGRIRLFDIDLSHIFS